MFERGYRVRYRSVGMVGLLALAAACNSRVDRPVVGTYRAVLELPGGETPVGLDVAREDDAYVLYLTNATERTRVGNVQVAEGELRAKFSGYENSLRATMSRRGLEGSITLIKSGGKEQMIPFQATLGDTHRFYAEPLSDNADVAGRWEMSLTDEKGNVTAAVALFEQSHDRVTGTVMTPTGDHRFLDGQVHGDDVQLSTFAGGLAYLYRLKVNGQGELQGDYWQGLAWHETVAAKRNADASLDGAGPATTLRDETQRFDFTFPDTEGRKISLSDERFRGKVVLITLGGTWCPNCHDEAAFLMPFYRQRRDQGFEVIALMFERHGEYEKAAAAVRNYRHDLGVEFTTLIAGVSDTDEASKALPTLSGIYGYPTTIFVDRRGAVRDIHVGFNGPATGAHYQEYIAEFRKRIDELLAEPAT
jgi:peroxiredoxin